jgi:hypothetical protein
MEKGREKKPYKPSKLTVLGTVEMLTRGGSGNASELQRPPGSRVV